MNKTKFHKKIRQNIFTKIYRNYHILAINSMGTEVCWEARLDLETLGLSLQCLLVNLDLCTAKLVCVRHWTFLRATNIQLQLTKLSVLRMLFHQHNHT